MLSRKLLLGLAPLLAVIALSVVPAMAQASPEWLVAGKAIPAGGKVAIKSHGGPFVLRTVGGGEITCTTLKDTGELFSGSPGTGLAFLLFTGCSSSICPGTLTIDEFHIIFTLLSLTDLSIFLLELEPVLVLCNGTLIGEIEETSLGAGFLATVSGKKLVFNKAGNLTFAGEEATVTGEDEQEGTSGESITVS